MFAFGNQKLLMAGGRPIGSLPLSPISTMEFCFDPDDERNLLSDQKAEPLCSYELAIREEYHDFVDPEAFHDPL